jgi:hypothetical protein
LDGTITLIGQPEEYWAGNYSLAMEGNPTFDSLLRMSPRAAVAVFAVWIGVYVGIILLLPDTLALIVSIAVTLLHAVGAATWLCFHFFSFQYGYPLCEVLLLFTAVLLGTSIRWGWQATPAQHYHLGLKPIRRWVAVAVLFAVAVYLIFWPYK